MKILDWPESERPRERLLAGGAGKLSDGELLAVLIGSGRRGRSEPALTRYATESRPKTIDPTIASATAATTTPTVPPRDGPSAITTSLAGG